jgi:hypothetical protein
LPQTLIWVPILPPGCQRGPQNKVGDIAINMGNMVPEVWDGNSWIPAVPANYPFPPQTPQTGTQWTDPMSQVVFIWNGLKWLKATGNGPTGVSLNPVPGAGTIEIRGKNNQVMVAIDTNTFTIKYGLGYTPDAAAQIFWEAINGLNPKNLQQQLTQATTELNEAKDEIKHYQSLGIKRPYKAPKPVDPLDAWDSAMGIIK